MFRLRRYRLFLIVAVFTTFTIYHFTRVGDWDVTGIEELRKFGLQNDDSISPGRNQPDTLTTLTHYLETDSRSLPTSAGRTLPPLEPSPTRLRESTLEISQAVLETPSVASIPSTIPDKPSQDSVEQTRSAVSLTAAAIPSSTVPINAPNVEDENRVAETTDMTEEFSEEGQGRLEVKARPPELGYARWKPQEEHFPVPKEDLKVLPTASASILPRIQHAFGLESDTAKADRMAKLATIKESLKHAWDGYSQWAMPHDELKPFSKGSSDPFNGWGATLVDSLDTLWIMGMTEEFEQAVGNVSRIDFTTSPRKDIPFFETVIRYLGGLISAYDVSNAKYPVLLDKAVTLAEILMGAFDTPNRMPKTHYYWAPSYASQPHRANVRTVLAEMGSLSMEFTRLAQITEEAKYYDAVARITDALETWQMNTTIPGLWPLKLDLSGCKKAEFDSSVTNQSPIIDPGDLEWIPYSKDLSVEVGKPVQIARPMDGSAAKTVNKRQLDDAAITTTSTESVTETVPSSLPTVKETKASVPADMERMPTTDVDCEPQGLSYEPHAFTYRYGIGAEADSTYEYLPKEYLLLGGQVEQYKSMYTNAMIPIREKILYRPMTEDSRDILFAGTVDFSPLEPNELSMTYEGSHLGCFAGGMFALGSKLFGIKDDLEIARKLTDGCIWAYESTVTGIMPEAFLLVPCDDMRDCAWNQTKYYDFLDPNEEERIEMNELWNESQRQFYEAQAPVPLPPTPTEPAGTDASVERTVKSTAGSLDTTNSPVDIKKRQLGYSESAKLDEVASNNPVVPTKTTIDHEEAPAAPAAPPERPAFSLKAAMSHKEFAEARIRDERLPSGFTSLRSRLYHLRPEAIESVFIMYRLTGEQYWRDEGWKMFQAIESATRTQYAHSAISDVTSEQPAFLDTMESFWLAETLKYCYLLFSDPDVISLDDYVLNTEAHPFRLIK